MFITVKVYGKNHFVHMFLWRDMVIKKEPDTYQAFKNDIRVKLACSISKKALDRLTAYF